MIAVIPDGVWSTATINRAEKIDLQRTGVVRMTNGLSGRLIKTAVLLAGVEPANNKAAFETAASAYFATRALAVTPHTNY